MGENFKSALSNLWKAWKTYIIILIIGIIIGTFGGFFSGKGTADNDLRNTAKQLDLYNKKANAELTSLSNKLHIDSIEIKQFEESIGSTIFTGDKLGTNINESIDYAKQLSSILGSIQKGSQ